MTKPSTETYQEYRMIWDYPFVRNLGEVRYGRVARTPEAAYGNAYTLPQALKKAREKFGVNA